MNTKKKFEKNILIIITWFIFKFSVIFSLKNYYNYNNYYYYYNWYCFFFKAFLLFEFTLSQLPCCLFYTPIRLDIELATR